MFNKVLKACLLIVITALSLGVVAALASLLLYGFVMAVIAALVGAVAAPDEVKAIWQAFAGRVDSWIARLEKLWKDVREGIDLWGAAQMQKQQGTASSPVSEVPTSVDEIKDVEPKQ